jgi:HAD superfamily hydrolase (TIGR01509 family)
VRAGLGAKVQPGVKRGLLPRILGGGPLFFFVLMNNDKKRKFSPPAQAAGTGKAPTPVPAMLFDLDGTLIDSVYEHVLAWHEAFDRQNIHIPNWKTHRRIGMSGQLFVPRLLREMGYKTTTSKIDRLEKLRAEAFQKRLPSIGILPGAAELLRTLSAMGVRWAIATSSDRRQVQKLLKGLHVPAAVPVVTGDDVKNAKPAPDLFLVAAERLGVSLGESVVVGDSPWDLLAARRMKALGVGLLCGGYSKEELQAAGAHRVYESPADLLENLADLGIEVMFGESAKRTGTSLRS